MRFNSCRYQARVVDLLDWKPPWHRRKKCSSAAKMATKYIATNKRQQNPLLLASGSPTKEQEDSTLVADSAREMEPREIKETPRRALSEITNTCGSPLPPSPSHSPLLFSSPHHSLHISPHHSSYTSLHHLSHSTLICLTHPGSLHSQCTHTPPTHLDWCTHSPLTHPTHLD